MNRLASWFRVAGILTALALLGADLSGARAATISYGDLGPVPPGVLFLSINESSSTDPVPLYGPPEPELFGAGLVGFDFDPVSFGAMGVGGTSDIADGQLNFIVISRVVNQTTGVGIESIDLSEDGDLSLLGAGNALTSVLAAVSIRADILEVDGSPIAPIPLSFSASVVYNLAANPGPLRVWSLSIGMPFRNFLSELGVPFNIGATKVEVTIDNQLAAFSQPNSIASIIKKNFVVGIQPHVLGNEIPEPAMFALIVVAVCGVAHRIRRRG